jgi:hypothetical protein
MTAAPLFPGFDGLMTLSRREGVDIRPTLLRVLTDLYVQTSAHNADEERQFVELTSRLIDQVDDATRASVRARLAIYPATPAEVLQKLGLKPQIPDLRMPVAAEIQTAPLPAAPVKPPTEAQVRMASNLSMQPKDAAEINEMFLRASASERALILHNLNDTPLRASARIPAARARRAVEVLEMAAFVSDVENFTLELGETLILPARVAAQVVSDPGGEPLACAMKAVDMPSPVFQRVLLFLNPEFGSSVNNVYRLRGAARPWRSPAPSIARRCTTTSATAPAPRRRRPARPCSPALPRYRARVRRARDANPSPDRESAALPGPRSRRSRRPDRT